MEATAKSDPGFALPEVAKQPGKQRRIGPLGTNALTHPAMALQTSLAQSADPSVAPKSTHSLVLGQLADLEGTLRGLHQQQPAAGLKVHQTVTFQLPQMFARGGRFWIQAELDDCISAPFALPTYSTRLELGTEPQQQAYWRRYMYPAASLRKAQ